MSRALIHICKRVISAEYYGFFWEKKGRTYKAYNEFNNLFTRNIRLYIEEIITPAGKFKPEVYDPRWKQRPEKGAATLLCVGVCVSVVVTDEIKCLA